MTLYTLTGCNKGVDLSDCCLFLQYAENLSEVLVKVAIENFRLFCSYLCKDFRVLFFLSLNLSFGCYVALFLNIKGDFCVELNLCA